MASLRESTLIARHLAIVTQLLTGRKSDGRLIEEFALLAESGDVLQRSVVIEITRLLLFNIEHQLPRALRVRVESVEAHCDDVITCCFNLFAFLNLLLLICVALRQSLDLSSFADRRVAAVREQALSVRILSQWL